MTLLPVDEAPTLRPEALRDLLAALTGDAIRPGDEAYDTARQVWNACVDKRPALIVRPAGTADVVQAVNFARAEGLPIAVRGGGHGMAGHGVCDNGLMLDMSRMKAIQVDPEA